MAVVMPPLAAFGPALSDLQTFAGLATVGTKNHKSKDLEPERHADVRSETTVGSGRSEMSASARRRHAKPSISVPVKPFWHTEPPSAEEQEVRDAIRRKLVASGRKVGGALLDRLTQEVENAIRKNPNSTSVKLGIPPAPNASNDPYFSLRKESGPTPLPPPRRE